MASNITTMKNAEGIKIMNKHTKGPWRVNALHGANILANDGILVTSQYETIKKEHYRPLPERQANAHLIAAAPDLLEALENVQLFVLELIAEQKRLDNKPMTYGQAKILDICQAAINKARGE